MGWIKSKSYRLGEGEVFAPQEVEEPAGYQGELITPAGQGHRKDKLRIYRKGREVLARKPNQNNIKVEVHGGIAYCDNPQVEIIDYDDH